MKAPVPSSLSAAGLLFCLPMRHDKRDEGYGQHGAENDENQQQLVSIHSPYSTPDAVQRARALFPAVQGDVLGACGEGLAQLPNLELISLRSGLPPGTSL
jgi:hypothetical protein